MPNVTKEAWETLKTERNELHRALENQTKMFALMDAQVARLWNHIGQMSMQHQDTININTKLLQIVEQNAKEPMYNVQHREEGEGRKDNPRPSHIPC